MHGATIKILRFIASRQRRGKRGRGKGEEPIFKFISL